MYRSHSPIQSMKLNPSNSKSPVSRTVAANAITAGTMNNKVINRTGKHSNGTFSTSSAFTNEVDKRPKSNWREQHEEFIKTVRAARGVKVDEASESNNSLNNVNSHNSNNSASKKVPPGYVKCPTCERSFNRKAADRHIEWCAEKKSIASSRSSPQSLDAMAKFKARSTYKPSIEPSNRVKNGRNVTSNANNSTLGKGNNSNNLQINNKSTANNRRRSNSNLKNSLSASNLKEAKSSDTINITPSSLRHSSERLTNVRGKSNDRSNGKSLTTSPGNKGIGSLTSIIPNTGSKIKAFLASSNNKIQPKTPIVKFKDKFPLAANGNSLTSTYMAGSDSLQELLKRPPDHESYSKQPKTVPGVRTGGGMSPIKSVGTFEQANGSASSFANSLSIMKRSLDDLMLFNASKSTASRNSIPNVTGASVGSNGSMNHRASVVTMTNGNCIGLNGLHGSTTSINGNGGASIDSGLVARGSTSGSSQEDQLIEQRKNSLANSEESSTGTVTNRMGSGGNNNLPRWCHQCGTKYPMQGAKYCYECGARRLGTLASLIG